MVRWERAFFKASPGLVLPKPNKKISPRQQISTAALWKGILIIHWKKTKQRNGTGIKLIKLSVMRRKDERDEIPVNRLTVTDISFIKLLFFFMLWMNHRIIRQMLFPSRVVQDYPKLTEIATLMVISRNEELISKWWQSPFVTVPRCNRIPNPATAKLDDTAM